MDIGPLEMGDYLGIILVNPIYLEATHSVCDLLIYDNFQQLEQYLLQRILFARCRFDMMNFLHSSGN